MLLVAHMTPPLEREAVCGRDGSNHDEQLQGSVGLGSATTDKTISSCAVQLSISGGLIAHCLGIGVATGQETGLRSASQFFRLGLSGARLLGMGWRGQQYDDSSDKQSLHVRSPLVVAIFQLDA